jgi:thiosulfate dehydrogenase
VATAAGFVHANMPLGLGSSLSETEAWDVAAFIDSRPRPQDPRFTGDLAATRAKFHADGDFYGQTVDGVLLGGGKPGR